MKTESNNKISFLGVIISKHNDKISLTFFVNLVLLARILIIIASVMIFSDLIHVKLLSIERMLFVQTGLLLILNIYF